MQIDKQLLPTSVPSVQQPKTRRESLPDGTPYYGATYYENHNLDGAWDIAVKIDGIRCIKDQKGIPCSRAGNAFIHEVAEQMPHHMADAELFRNDWSTSMSLKAATIQCTPDDWYSLDPIDPRLVLYQNVIVTKENLEALMWQWINKGFEGLVIRQGTKWLKCVPLRYADVIITGWIEGTGEQKGMMGSFTTPYGRVSCSTMTREDKIKCWQLRHQLAGKVVEAAYREMTNNGKMRMARFHRFRFDKTTNSI